jgi:hypothetical protein
MIFIDTNLDYDTMRIVCFFCGVLWSEGRPGRPTPKSPLKEIENEWQNFSNLKGVKV